MKFHSDQHLLICKTQQLFKSQFTNKKIMPWTSYWWKRLSAIDLLIQKDSSLKLSQVLFWSAFTNLRNTTTIQELIYEQKNHAKHLLLMEKAEYNWPPSTKRLLVTIKWSFILISIYQFAKHDNFLKAYLQNTQTKTF